jgi:hypothetical protein
MVESEMSFAMVVWEISHVPLAVILKREVKTLQKTFVVNGIRDKTLNPFSNDRKSVVSSHKIYIGF